MNLLDYELTKVKNKVETALRFSNIKVLDKALNFAFFELLGDALLIADEAKKYAAVTPSMIKEHACRCLIDSNCSTLEYVSDKL